MRLIKRLRLLLSYRNIFSLSLIRESGVLRLLNNVNFFRKMNRDDKVFHCKPKQYNKNIILSHDFNTEIKKFIL